jgi:hypothetical protein
MIRILYFIPPPSGHDVKTSTIIISFDSLYLITFKNNVLNSEDKKPLDAPYLQA